MRLSPYIFFNGNCQEAMNFYVETFGGTVTDLSHYENAPVESAPDDKNKIMHAKINIGNNVIMVCDSTSGKVDMGSNVQLTLEFDEVEELNQKFEILAIGGSVTMPLQDTFWGARFGMLKDQFGIYWMFSCQLRK